VAPGFATINRCSSGGGEILRRRADVPFGRRHETVGKFVELLLTTADEDTQTAVATGYLESLLAQASSGAIDFRSIAGTLGPESSKYCRAWDTFTGVKTDGLW
jgi:hypothetical protein